MRTDIITIGTEYLTGMISETDSFYLAGRLAELNSELVSLITVGDDPDEIRNVLKKAFESEDMILVTGGCRYGKDPVYQEIFAELFDRKAGLNDAAFEHIKKTAAEKGSNVSDEDITTLATIPEDAQVLFNHEGLACGYILTDGKKHLIVLPGSSAEIRAVFEDDAVGYIYKTTSLGESGMVIELKEDALDEKDIREKLADLLANDNPELALIKSGRNFRITISAVGPTEGDASVIAFLTASDCTKRLGEENIKEERIRK